MESSSRVPAVDGETLAEKNRRLKDLRKRLQEKDREIEDLRVGPAMDGAAGGLGSDAPPFFVVGRAKSGTTWLRNLLDAHPEILCRGEGTFFGRGADLGERRGLITPTSLHGALADSDYLRTWIEKKPMWTRGKEAEEHLMNLTRLCILYFLGEQLASSGKRLVGDKTPLITEHDIQHISSIMPGSKVIHIIRDGRDAAVSGVHHVWNRAADAGGHFDVDPEMLRKRDAYRADPEAFVKSGESIFTEGQLEWTARDWADLVGKTIENGPAALGENYLEVRYETMLAEPEAQTRRLLEFLDALADEEAVGRCVERGSFERRTKGRRQGQEDPTAFMRKGVAGDWKNVFTEEDKRVFKREAGDLLVKLGYEKDHAW